MSAKFQASKKRTRGQIVEEDQQRWELYGTLATLIARGSLGTPWPKQNSSSWLRGRWCEPGKPLNRDRVLVDRAQEIFNSFRGSTEEKLATPLKAFDSFDLVRSVAPKDCSCYALVTQKYCSNCSSPNKQFDKKTRA